MGSSKTSRFGSSIDARYRRVWFIIARGRSRSVSVGALTDGDAADVTSRTGELLAAMG
jgi:hypothetical protein